MYKPLPEYQQLKAEFDRALKEKKKANPSFNPYSIDDVLPETILDQYKHDTAVFLAVTEGLTYSICPGYSRAIQGWEKETGKRIIFTVENHQPIYRVNGKFKPISGSLEQHLQDRHSQQENSTACKDCAKRMRDYSNLKRSADSPPTVNISRTQHRTPAYLQ